MKRCETLIPFKFKEADISNVPEGIRYRYYICNIIWISEHYSSELYLFPVDSVTCSVYRNEKKTPCLYVTSLSLIFYTRVLLILLFTSRSSLEPKNSRLESFQSYCFCLISPAKYLTRNICTCTNNHLLI